MPFENVRQLEQSDIQGIDNLSDREKRIFLKVFNNAVYGGDDEQSAIKQAFSATHGGGGNK